MNVESCETQNSGEIGSTGDLDGTHVIEVVLDLEESGVGQDWNFHYEAQLLVVVFAPKEKVLHGAHSDDMVGTTTDGRKVRVVHI